MNREQHLKTDLILLGYTDYRIHYMMDKFADASYELGPGHRSLAHNQNTIMFLKNEFGEYAKYLALLHILVDNKIVDRDYLEELCERCEYEVSREEVRLEKAPR